MRYTTKLTGPLLLLVSMGLAWGCTDRRSATAPDLSLSGAEGGASSSSAVGNGTRSQVAADFPFTKILCFGDSLTYGVTQQTPGLPSGAQTELAPVEGYVNKLWRRLEQEYGTGFELVNAGLGAENTTEGVDRLRYEMAQHNPDLVLLLEGVVDVNNSAPRFPVVRENLAFMMELAHRQGRVVIIGTYPRLNTDGFRTNGAENIPRLNDVIRQEANKQGVAIADHEMAVLGDLTGQGPDGLHPNNQGYEVMAQTWFETIVALVEGET